MVDLHRLPDNSASVPSRFLSVEGASEADRRAKINMGGCQNYGLGFRV